MQLLVSMTGFVHDPSLPNYQQMLQQLGCKYAQQLSNDVNYLIVNHVCTQKYKIAELDKSSIQCITIKWLDDSVKAKKVLPVDKYRVDKVFYGVRLAVEGFQDKESLARLKRLLQDNGVIQVKEGMFNEEMNQKYQLVIISNSKLYRKLQPKILDLLCIPVVTTQWLEQSLQRKKCKYPNDYALNLTSISTKQFNDNPNVRRLNRKLQSFMQLQFMNIKMSQNLSTNHNENTNKKKAMLCNQEIGDQMIIYLDENSIDKAFCDLLKKLIAVNGGIYLNQYGPIVTHILVGVIDENQYIKFLNYGDSCHILRVQWIIDSILFAQKQPEVDFKVRSFKSTLIKSMNSLELREMQNHRYMHSQTLIHSHLDLSSRNPNASMTLIQPPKMQSKTSRKNISISKDPVQIQKIIPTKVKVIKTDIFKGRYFYIDKNNKKEITQPLLTKIRQNGGYAVSESSLSSVTNSPLLVVMKDSQKNEQILNYINKMVNGTNQTDVKNIKAIPNNSTIGQTTTEATSSNPTDQNNVTKTEVTKTKNKVKIIPVSSRWIDQCIKKSQFVNFDGQNFFAFKPLNIETPAKQLMTMRIQILGLDDILKRRIKQLLIALGVYRACPNIAQITHCLCKNGYESDPKYQAIMQAIKNPNKLQKETTTKDEVGNCKPCENIKFIRYEWVLDFSNKGGKINIDDYLIKVEDKLN